MRAAVDIGGTFTDVLCYDEKSGQLWSTKVHSSPKKPAAAFIVGLQEVATSAQTSISEFEYIFHATTTVTNSIVEGNTARIGLIVTEGFKDILEIGRQVRPDLYDLQVDRKPPIVSREYIHEVRERISAKGDILIPLDSANAQKAIKSLIQQNIESIAVVLLFSFLDPSHELTIKEIIKSYLPIQYIFLSSEVSPEFREYERASTTAVAASVAPHFISYINTMQSMLRECHCQEYQLHIMHSGGGVVPPHEAVRKPHTIIESGPAAGVIAASQLSKTLSYDRVIAFDMGGTTAKASLILNASPQYTCDYEVGGEIHQGTHVQGSGYPIRFPMIDVAECGAGAGSIAWVDQGGHLKVGPQSAGAEPGPACYGKGGLYPTVTDAYIVLGYLSPSSLLGVKIALQRDLAVQAITTHVCTPLGLSLEEGANGILRIANANMLKMLRLVSIARGYDPRHFILFAYGGAGPMHATSLAQEMDIHTVVVPLHPGIFSALGLLHTDMTTDFVRTDMTILTAEQINKINGLIAQLKKMANKLFINLEVPKGRRQILVTADMRYLHQNYELNIPLPTSRLSFSEIKDIQNHFHKAHERAYGHCNPRENIQIVNVRLRAIRRLTKPSFKLLPTTVKSSGKCISEKRSVFMPTGTLSAKGYQVRQCTVFYRDTLPSGFKITGPAIIQEKNATTVIGPGWNGETDSLGNIILSNYSMQS